MYRQCLAYVFLCCHAGNSFSRLVYLQVEPCRVYLLSKFVACRPLFRRERRIRLFCSTVRACTVPVELCSAQCVAVDLFQEPDLLALTPNTALWNIYPLGTDVFSPAECVLSVGHRGIRVRRSATGEGLQRFWLFVFKRFIILLLLLFWRTLKLVAVQLELDFSPSVIPVVLSHPTAT